MANIEIAGHVCTFPSLDINILRNYHPTPRTTQLSYVTPPRPHNLMLIAMMDSMYAIGAIERPPYYCESGHRTTILLEHPNKNVLDTLERWLYWTVGTRWKIMTPYRIAKAADDEAHYEKWDSLQLVKTPAGKRPLMGRHPPSRTLPRIPDQYPDDPGATLKPPEWEQKHNLDNYTNSPIA